MEVLLVFLLRGPYKRGVEWPVFLVGVAAAVLLIIGYVPVPFEIVKRRGHVIGIDWVFLTIDWFGAFFSLMALGTLTTFTRARRNRRQHADHRWFSGPAEF